MRNVESESLREFSETEIDEFQRTLYVLREPRELYSCLPAFLRSL